MLSRASEAQVMLQFAHRLRQADAAVGTKAGTSAGLDHSVYLRGSISRGRLTRHKLGCT